MLHPLPPPPEHPTAVQQLENGKRLKACESCRHRKIRCPGPSNAPEGTQLCANCRRFHRECVFRPKTVVKRRKRVESRMRELEDKILDLSARIRSPVTDGTHISDIATQRVEAEASDHSSQVAEPDSLTADTIITTANYETSSPGSKVLLDHDINCTLTRSKLWRKPHERSAGGCKSCKTRKQKVSTGKAQPWEVLM